MKLLQMCLDNLSKIPLRYHQLIIVSILFIFSLYRIQQFNYYLTKLKHILIDQIFQTFILKERILAYQHIIFYQK